jgi:hypothetical protein
VNTIRRITALELLRTPPRTNVNGLPAKYFALLLSYCQAERTIEYYSNETTTQKNNQFFAVVANMAHVTPMSK